MSKISIFYYLGLITQLGFSMLFSILLFLAVGIFLDNKFNSRGIMIFIFSLLGIGVGFFSCYKLIAGRDFK